MLEVMQIYVSGFWVWVGLTVPMALLVQAIAIFAFFLGRGSGKNNPNKEKFANVCFRCVATNFKAHILRIPTIEVYNPVPSPIPANSRIVRFPPPNARNSD